MRTITLTTGRVEIKANNQTTIEVEIELDIKEIVEQLGIDDVLDTVGKEKCVEYFWIIEDDGEIMP